MIRKLGLIVGLLALSPLAMALAPRTLEDFGVQTTFHARSSVTTSYTVTGIPLQWKVAAIGGSADFTVGVSSGDQANGYAILTSSTIYALQGSSNAMVSPVFHTVSYNPVVTITRIDTPGTTVYVTVDYFYPRKPGAY